MRSVRRLTTAFCARFSDPWWSAHMSFTSSHTFTSASERECCRRSCIVTFISVFRLTLSAFLEDRSISIDSRKHYKTAAPASLKTCPLAPFFASSITTLFYVCKFCQPACFICIKVQAVVFWALQVAHDTSAVCQCDRVGHPTDLSERRKAKLVSVWVPTIR